MVLQDFKKQRPETGTTVLAFSPVYKRGDPMRWRFVQVLSVGMDEVSAYATMADLESQNLAAGVFSS